MNQDEVRAIVVEELNHRLAHLERDLRRSISNDLSNATRPLQVEINAARSIAEKALALAVLLYQQTTPSAAMRDSAREMLDAVQRNDASILDGLFD